MKTRSLRVRLLAWQLVSFLILSVLTCIAIGIIANQLSRQIYDEHLVNSVDSVYGRIQDDHNDIDVNLPAAARAMLRHKDKDNFYYQVVNSSDKVLDYDCPIAFPSKHAEPGKMRFYNSIIEGSQVRVLEARVPHPANPKDFLYIEVAETFNTRKAFAATIMSALLTAQFVFMTCSAIVIYITVGKGLQPLRHLQQGLAECNPGDLKPLSIADAPSEVLQLVQIINQLLEQVNEHIQGQIRFAANVAHQLRTPLSGVKTYVELALRSTSETKVSEILQRTDYGITRLISLIERMLLLARCDPALLAGKISSLVDLNTVVKETIGELAEQAQEKDIKVRCRVSSSAVQVMGDPISLHELTRNIIANAIAYSPNSETIDTIIEAEERVLLIVEDNGPGIPVEDRERVFEPFYRAASVYVEGNGLGLSIARDIAKAHGATISIEDSHKTKGIRVIVNFPRVATSDRVQLATADSA
jgi:two-component system sensor histidine kinase TctE